MMPSEDHKTDLISLFRSQSLAVLATQKREFPYCSLVAFCATPDLKHILFATSRSTRKFSNLSANSKVALLVDSRSEDDENFEKAIAATICGEAEEIDKEKENSLLSSYLNRHPHLEKFVTSPSCALVKVDVTYYKVVRRFEEILELRIGE